MRPERSEGIGLPTAGRTARQDADRRKRRPHEGRPRPHESASTKTSKLVPDFSIILEGDRNVTLADRRPTTTTTTNGGRQ
jgi:hypothetical protein